MNSPSVPENSFTHSGVRVLRRLGPLIAGTLILTVGGCAHSGRHQHEEKPETHQTPEGTADARFEQLKSDFLEGHYQFRPLAGVALGWHQYDGKFMVPTRAAILAEQNRLKKFGMDFRALGSEKLSPVHRHDLRVLSAAISQELFSMEVQRAPWHNPMTYASALDTTVYLKRDFKPLPERIKDITAILQQAKPLMAAARANLEPVLPKPFIETAIDAVKGTADFIANDVSKAVTTVNDPVIQSQYVAAMKTAVAEIRAYADWLNTKMMPQGNDGYAIGRAGYIEMLNTEFIGLTPEQILEAGMKELVAEQQRFTDAAREIDPTKSPQEVFKDIQKDHPTAAGLIPDARKDLESIRKFVVDHRILTIPSSVRARVEETRV